MNSFKSSRRNFLGKSSVLLAGGFLLPSSLAFANAEKNTTELLFTEKDFEESNDIRKPFAIAKSVKVWGKIFSKDGKTPLANTQIKIWHLSPKSKQYGHLGKFTTNTKGEYTFWTDFPDREEGKYPRIHFEITQEGRVTTSELLLGNDEAHITSKHWEKNNVLGEKLFPIMKNGSFETQINFNITTN